ncbi:MAG: hypothetical protein JO247_04945 [Chloroflexi bacterium]|nr:hypothetical protein [Chloroflexota bacterium]
MASVRPVNPVGQWETRPAGNRPSQVAHPVNIGPPAVNAVSPLPSPPAGDLALATQFRIVAQVRDGIAMFGTGKVAASGPPPMGSGTASALAQTTSQRIGAGDAIAGQAMDLQHLTTPASA